MNELSERFKGNYTRVQLPDVRPLSSDAESRDWGLCSTKALLRQGGTITHHPPSSGEESHRAGWQGSFGLDRRLQKAVGARASGFVPFAAIPGRIKTLIGKGYASRVTVAVRSQANCRLSLQE